MKKATDEMSPQRRSMRNQIDENLKRVYSDALTEEIPDRFLQLLAQLKDKGTSGQGDQK